MEPLELEQVIMDDVARRTGLRFRQLAGIPTKDAGVARLVLPVLKEWPDRVPFGNIRCAIYMVFGTTFAHDYFDDIVRWWKQETDDLDLSFLTQVVGIVMRPSDAQLVLHLTRTLPTGGMECLLWSKLAAFPSVAEEARLELVKRLQSVSASMQDLSFISKVDDPRINSWFASHVDSSNKHLRVIARRVVDRGKRLASGLLLSDIGPDVTKAIISTEVDLAALPKLFSSIEQQMAKKLPSSIRSTRFLSAIAVDQWVYFELNGQDGGSARLWFRLECVDVVEVALTTDATARKVS